MENNALGKVAGIEKVGLKMLDEMVRTLDEVRHVLDLKKNLI